MNKYWGCLKLNLNMLRHVLKGRWLSGTDLAASYDLLAGDYNAEWLARLKPVTDCLLHKLPAAGPRQIIDLGCGTGYTCAFLEKQYPDAFIRAVDISSAMLENAKLICCRTAFICDDMLGFIRQQDDSSVDMIVSAWAVGYSHPEKVFRECSRVLRKGGILAFVVNYADTLDAVFSAFRKSMARFPERTGRALWPHFPRHRKEIEEMLKIHQFHIRDLEEGLVPIASCGSELRLERLLKTGVLAGFDAVLPLRDDPEVAEYFNQELKQYSASVNHHYVMVWGTKI